MIHLRCASPGTVLLSGLPYRAASPSHFEQVGAPLTIAFDGTSWLIAVRSVYGTREFASRQEASDLIATAFINARENLG